MATRLVTLATFPSTALAMLAHNVLADAGIDSEVTEGNTSWAFSGLLGEVKLIVAEENAERAEQILDEQARLFRDESDETEIEPESHEENAVEDTDDYRPTDYSPGATNLPGLAQAAACVSPWMPIDAGPAEHRSRASEIPTSCARSNKAENVPAAPPPDVPADVVDDLVTRAFRASMIGIVLFPPLVTFYSAWLLLQAAGAGGDFDQRQHRRFITALVINVIVGGLSSLFWWEVVGVPIFVE